MTTTTDHPAINDYLEQLAVNGRRDLIRSLVTLTQTTTLSSDDASRIALGAGIPLTRDDIENAVEAMEDAAHPDAALDRYEFDEGVVTGDRHDALARISAVAQQDLDSLIDTAARHAAPVATETAVLAAVNVLTGER